VNEETHHSTGRLIPRIRGLVQAIREGDEATVEAAVIRLSRSRRWLAPLALTVGAMVMLFEGLRLVFSNWRLTLIQVLPAMWIWLAMLDLKLHVLHGNSIRVVRGPLAAVVVIVVTALTTASFYLNAMLAFSITPDGVSTIRAARARTREHLRAVLAWGIGVGLLLAFATVIVTRLGRPWFGLTLSLVVGLMMVSYVAVPSRLIGVRPVRSRRDKFVASAVSGAVGAAVCTPPYLIGRIGLLMLGTRALLVPGIFVVALGFTLQAGATGAVKAIKMSATLLAGSQPAVRTAAVGDGPAADSGSGSEPVSEPEDRAAAGAGGADAGSESDAGSSQRTTVPASRSWRPRR
jgi:hypothetical protein